MFALRVALTLSILFAIIWQAWLAQDSGDYEWVGVVAGVLGSGAVLSLIIAIWTL